VRRSWRNYTLSTSSDGQCALLASLIARNLSLDTVAAICAALEVALAEFFSGFG